MDSSDSDTSDVDNEMGDYERKRLRNISEMRLEFSNLFEDVRESAQNLASSSALNQNVPTSRKRSRNTQGWRPPKKKSKINPGEPRLVRRSARINKENRKKTNYNEENDSDDNNEKPKEIKFKFPWHKNIEHQQKDVVYYSTLVDDDFIVDDEDVEYYFDDEPRPKRAHVPRCSVKMVTQQMINNITYSSSNKNYSTSGTTCHQCRQKTTDQKTYCRYKGCRGSRGMFCGFCLGKRYGEDIATVLLNPKWACPPCRGYCNCSICRRRQGRLPTGQLAPRAEAEGFKSVRHMLSSTEGETSTQIRSDESEIDEDDESEDVESNNNNNMEQDDNETQIQSINGNNNEIQSINGNEDSEIQPINDDYANKIQSLNDKDDNKIQSINSDNNKIQSINGYDDYEIQSTSSRDDSEIQSTKSDVSKPQSINSNDDNEILSMNGSDDNYSDNNVLKPFLNSEEDKYQQDSENLINSTNVEIAPKIQNMNTQEIFDGLYKQLFLS